MTWLWLPVLVAFLVCLPIGFFWSKAGLPFGLLIFVDVLIGVTIGVVWALWVA